MLGPKNKDDLKSISDFNSDWADRVAYLILVGLLVDIADLFVPEGWWRIAVAIGANLSIFGGVWGELWFAKRAREADDSRVAEANARAEEAKMRTAKLEKEAAELRRQASESSNEILRLQLPRQLNETKFLTELDNSSKAEVEIIFDGNTRDGSAFSAQLMRLLLKAEWKATINFLPERRSGSVFPPTSEFCADPFGITVIGRSTDPPRPVPGTAFMALWQAIAIGMESPVWPTFNADPRLPEGKLRVVVCAKD